SASARAIHTDTAQTTLRNWQWPLPPCRPRLGHCAPAKEAAGSPRSAVSISAGGCPEKGAVQSPPTAPWGTIFLLPWCRRPPPECCPLSLRPERTCPGSSPPPESAALTSTAKPSPPP